MRAFKRDLTYNQDNQIATETRYTDLGGTNKIGSETFTYDPADRLTILLADDNVDGAESLAALLRLGGHEVRLAHDGRSALDLAAKTKPDVVVLDLFLGTSSGLDVARRLRIDPRHAGIAIIALSGHAAQEHRDAAAEAGCDAYLVKPCLTEQLVEAIERVLSAKIAAA